MPRGELEQLVELLDRGLGLDRRVEHAAAREQFEHAVDVRERLGREIAQEAAQVRVGRRLGQELEDLLPGLAREAGRLELRDERLQIGVGERPLLERRELHARMQHEQHRVDIVEVLQPHEDPSIRSRSRASISSGRQPI